MRALQDHEKGFGCLLRAHDGVTRVGPGENEPRIEGLAAEGIVARAERASDDDGDLWDDAVADRVDQLRAAADDPGMFRLPPDHESLHVLKENDRNARLVAVHHEPCRL